MAGDGERCWYELLSDTLAKQARTDIPDDLPPCPELAVFSVFVRLKQTGQDIEVFTQMCDGHEREAVRAPGYVKSIRIRPQKPIT